MDKSSNTKQHDLDLKIRGVISGLTLPAITSVGFVVVFLTLLFLGIRRAYSGVPFWDEWNGSLDFITKFSGDNLGSIFVQHNEHRIVIFRLIALFNYHIMNNQIWFLIVVNILILIGIVHILYRYFKLVMDPEVKLSAQVKLVVVSLLVIIESSWMQQQNINWGFQSQFLLGIYLPMVSFYFLQRSWQTDKTYFLNLSILFGVLSAGTIASGLVVLPLMLFGALICKRYLSEILKLLVMSLLVVIIWIQGYSTNGNLMVTLFTNIYGVIEFIAFFITAPISKSFGEPTEVAAFIIFLGLIIFIVPIVYRNLRYRNLAIGEGVLVLPILYLLSFMSLTAIGRANSGYRDALESRYTSVTLVLYSLILIIYITKRIQLKKVEPVNTWLILGVIIALFLPSQFDALSRDTNAIDQRISAMSLNLGIVDDDQALRIFSNPTYLYELAPKIISANKGIFADPIFQESRNNKTIEFNNLKTVECEVRVDKVYLLSQKNYKKVFGWSFIPYTNKPLGDFLVINSDGRIVGAGLSGIIRADVDSYLNRENVDAGFAFYIKEKSTELFMVDPHSNLACKMPNFD